jgi:hypothetical protein
MEVRPAGIGGLAVMLGALSVHAQDRGREDIAEVQQKLNSLGVETNVFWRNMTPVRRPFCPGGANCEGFRSGEVDSFYSEYKYKLNSTFAKPDLLPFYDYVESRIPPPARDRFSSEYGQLVSVPEGQRMARQLVSLTDELKVKANDLVMSLRVESVPDGAVFKLLRVTGKPVREGATNTTLAGIYRGLYRYEVTRPGFKTISSDLNLVDTTPNKLHCELHSSTSKSGPLPCNSQ